MKKIFFAVFLLLTTACKSQKYSNNLKEVKMKIDKLDNKSKKIDASILRSQIGDFENLHKNNLPLFVKKESVTYVNKENEDYILDEYNLNKEIIKTTRIKPNNQIEINEKIDDYFHYYETYFGNGNIKSKLIGAYRYGFAIGMLYKYDENGKLLETIDTDAGYKFTFENLFEFCKTNEISFNSNTYPLNILKITRPDGKKTWVIMNANEKKMKIETYVLDALDGTILLKEESDWPVFKHR